MSKEHGMDREISPESSSVYPLFQLRKGIEKELANKTGYSGENVRLQEAPSNMGVDYGFQIASVAKGLRENPVQLAQKLAGQHWNVKYLSNIVNQGPYLNFKLEMGGFGNSVLDQVISMGKEYGKDNIGKGRRVVVDMSSPNIAKEMGYGHLRSTIIGDAISNLYDAEGYKVVRDNHIGDWGTQFGKQIAALKLWGNEKELLKSKEPVGELQKLYQKFHAEAEKEPKLDDLGREWFLKLEQGDPEAKRLWKMCVDLSLKQFNEVYNVLKVKFDVTLGESFYEPMLKGVMQKVEKSPISKRSEGALVVDMADKNLGVAIIQKKDGASVYMTRDLAAAIYREEKMKADKAIYVVGEDQKLYFRQLFEVLGRMGHSIGEKSEHVYFGMVRTEEGKMSTRKGTTILLKDVINEGLTRAENVIEKRNPDLFSNRKKREEVSKQVAIGALKWNDLCADARRPILFNWDNALNFEGYSAPYVQYAAVRCDRILEKSGLDVDDLKGKAGKVGGIYEQPAEKKLIKTIASYPSVLREAQEQNNPSIVASGVFELAKQFSSFYNDVPVLNTKDEAIKISRLKLVAATSQVIKNSMAVLGIEIPREM